MIQWDLMFEEDLLEQSHICERVEGTLMMLPDIEPGRISFPVWTWQLLAVIYPGSFLVS